MRVLCVEDDVLVRTYLAARLELEPDLRVVGTVASAGEALRLLRAQPVDLILLDYRLEGADGLQLLRALTASGTAPCVLFYTGLADEYLERRARELGAAGVVSKTSAGDTLLRALRVVAGGGTWFSEPEAEVCGPGSR
jgi:DNA-binding NarL/FixJ family response regulator